MPDDTLIFKSPVEFDQWTAVYAAMISRPYWGADEDVHAKCGASADLAVREMRKRRRLDVNHRVQSMDRDKPYNPSKESQR